MTRGNQREVDRQRAANRAARAGSSKNDDGLTPQQRNERDAKQLAEKMAKKAADKQASASASSGSKAPPPKKKVEKKKEDVASLLSEGLKKKK